MAVLVAVVSGQKTQELVAVNTNDVMGAGHIDQGLLVLFLSNSLNHE